MKTDDPLSSVDPASSPKSDQTAQDPGWMVLAHLLRPQGRKGELLADLLTDFPERFSTTPRVFLAQEDFIGTETEARLSEVVGYWLPVGRNQGRIVLQFAGIDSITLAESVVGLDVIVPASERPELEDDANYVSDLIGCALYDQGTGVLDVALGLVTAIHFATTPDGSRRIEEAAPLLAIETPAGDEVLIPFVKAFLISINHAARRIDMTLPEGLADVNRH